MKKISKLICVISSIAAVLISGAFVGCEVEEKPFSGIRFTGGNIYVEGGGSTQIKATLIKEDSEDKTATITYSIYNDTTGGATLSKTSELSGTEISVTAGNKSGFFGIKAECGTEVAYTSIGVEKTSTELSIDDKPVGFASLGVDISKMTTVKTVKTSAELRSANTGNCIIYVEGTIDMSDGILPAAGKTMNGANATSDMDAFIKANSGSSSVTTYSAWMAANTNVSAGSDTSTSSISNKYKSKIQIDVKANTAIIGVGNATIRGATFSIRNSNIILRNLTIQDAVDPFPHHEKNDGWNAQHDNICIDGGTNVWIDHCTLEDTLKLGTAANEEKWQIYDGLLDMKGNATNITVSNTILRNHDKTMLIGSSDKDGDAAKRFITLVNNHFDNCTQRCPMVRNSRIHILNNVYSGSSPTVNARAGSLVFDENNYGGSTPKNNVGTFVGADGIFDKAPRYSYVPRSVSEARTYVLAHAGAGKIFVK